MTSGCGVGAWVGGGTGVTGVIIVGMGAGGLTENGVCPGRGVGYGDATPFTSVVGEADAVGEGDTFESGAPESPPGPPVPQPSTNAAAEANKSASPILMVSTMLAAAERCFKVLCGWQGLQHDLADGQKEYFSTGD